VQEWAPGASAGITVAGGNGQGSAANQFFNANGLSVDGSGDVYVADGSNNRVQEWQTGPNGMPNLTMDPQSQTVYGSADVTFSAGAIGKPLPTMQWQHSMDGGSTWSNIAGATSSTYTITGVPLSDNGIEFRAIFTNAAGSATTNAATLTVTAAPPPTTNVGIPSNGATVIGDTWLDAGAQSPVGLASVTFEVSGGSISDQVISGSIPTAYGYIGAWNSTSMPNGTYTIQSVATDTLGQSTTSAPITITVNNPVASTSMLIPTNGATLSGTELLDAGSTAGVSAVSFEVSGGTLSDQVISSSAPTIYGWLGGWNTTTVPNGTYTLQSVGTLAAGGTVTSAPITVTVSN
jgi:hypothetical protein